MKNRSKIGMISTALLCLAAGSVFAGPPGPPPGGAERHIERLAILLDLDAGQKVAVQKVMEERREQIKALRQHARSSDKTTDARPTREQRLAQHEQMRKETQEKLRGILSDTQMKKFEVLTERPFHVRPGMRHMHGGADDAPADKAP